VLATFVSLSPQFNFMVSSLYQTILKATIIYKTMII